MIARKKMEAFPLSKTPNLNLHDQIHQQELTEIDPFKRFVTEWRKELEIWQCELFLFEKLARRSRMVLKKSRETKAGDFLGFHEYMRAGIIRLRKEVDEFETELMMMRLNKEVSASKKLQKFERVNLLIRNFEDGVKSRRIQFLEQLYNAIPVTIY